MSRRRQLSDDERALGGGVVRSIKPLRGRTASSEPPAAGGDDTALALLLDHAELRLVAAVLADMMARLLADYAGDDPAGALDALAQLRPVLMRAGPYPPPDAQPGG